MNTKVQTSICKYKYNYLSRIKPFKKIVKVYKARKVRKNIAYMGGFTKSGK